MTNVAFGSIDVLPGAAFSTNATLSINCSGLSIFPTTVFVCVTFPTPWTMQGPSSSTLQYGLLGPPPATTSWSNTTAIAVPVTGSILGFTASANVNVAATLLANQQSAPPGNYLQTVNATVTYSTATCASGLIVGSGGFSFQVSATVLKSCNVDAGNLDFGTVGNLASTVAGQSNIVIQCSNGVGYSIALNGGLSGAVDPTQRKMAFGAGSITTGSIRTPLMRRPGGARQARTSSAGPARRSARCIQFTASSRFNRLLRLQPTLTRSSSPSPTECDTTFGSAVVHDPLHESLWKILTSPDIS